jgi:hypothetical protein
MRPTLATVARRRWLKLAESSGPPVRLRPASSFFALHSGIPLFAQDMVGERAAVVRGDAQKIVWPRFKRASRRSNAQQATRIGELVGAAPDGFSCAGCRVEEVARRQERIAGEGRVGDRQRRSIRRRRSAHRLRRAASRRRPIFSAAADRSSAGAGLRGAEASAEAAAGQAEASKHRSARGRAEGTLSGADVHPGLRRTPSFEAPGTLYRIGGAY